MRKKFGRLTKRGFPKTKKNTKSMKDPSSEYYNTVMTIIINNHNDNFTPQATATTNSNSESNLRKKLELENSKKGTILRKR